MQDFLIQLSTTHSYFVFLFIIFTACIEGPILSILFGILIKLGYFHFAPIYVALMFGDLFGDVIWYVIGRHFGHPFVTKYGKYFSISEHRIKKVEHIFHKYTKSILIISKVTMGFGFAIVTLFTAGLTKIPFKTYIALNFIGQFVWTAILVGLGYYFSHLYMVLDGYFAKASLILLFGILIGAFIGFSKYIKGKLSA